MSMTTKNKFLSANRIIRPLLSTWKMPYWNQMAHKGRIFAFLSFFNFFGKMIKQANVNSLNILSTCCLREHGMSFNETLLEFPNAASQPAKNVCS